MKNVHVLDQKTGIRESTWQAELLQLERLNIAVPERKTGSGGVRVVFGSAKGLCDDACRDVNSRLFPCEFLESLEKDLNGSYGSRRMRPHGATLESRNIWYGFKVKQVTLKNEDILYGWQQVVSFTKLYADGFSSFILCLDCPPSIQEQLQKKIMSVDPICTLEWQGIFIEAMRDLYDTSVWSLRDCVRSAELKRSKSNDSTQQSPQRGFVYLHELSRHTIHSNETLDVAVDTAECIRKGCRTIEGHDSSHDPCQSESQDQLYMLEKDIKRIKRRSESLNERLQNEINLAFNLVAQRDNQIMVKMGEDSRSDNNNMRSIAVVGLIYLPGTFISGLFGMNFFDFDVDGSGVPEWHVSERLWMYWAITIPVTLLTIIVWVVGFHRDALWKQVGRLKRWRGIPEAKAENV